MNNKIKHYLKHILLYVLFAFNIFVLSICVYDFFDIVIINYNPDNYWGSEIMGFWWRSRLHYTIGMLILLIPSTIFLYVAFKEINRRIYMSYILLTLPLLFQILIGYIINHIIYG